MLRSGPIPLLNQKQNENEMWNGEAVKLISTRFWRVSGSNPLRGVRCFVPTEFDERSDDLRSSDWSKSSLSSHSLCRETSNGNNFTVTRLRLYGLQLEGS